MPEIHTSPESARYKLTDEEFTARLRAKMPNGSLARPILPLFREKDGSVAREQTLEWFESLLTDAEMAELTAKTDAEAAEAKA